MTDYAISTGNPPDAEALGPALDCQSRSIKTVVIPNRGKKNPQPASPRNAVPYSADPSVGALEERAPLVG